MYHRQAVVLGLLAGLLAGCATGQPATHTAWLNRLRPFHGPAGPDILQMDVALLEREVGDPTIDHDVWAVVDEQVVSPERRALLEDNGFRVGQIGGMPPAALQKLLTSERSCINPRRLQLHADNATTLVVGPCAGTCRFQLQQDGQATQVALEQAECIVSVTPSLTEDGRIRLHFTPQVRHGEASMQPGPAADRSGWVLQQQRPTESYEPLGWDVTVAPNEYVVVGARSDRPKTLGHESFIRPAEALPVQRLLVIRTTRPDKGLEPMATSDGPPEFSLQSKSPPLALQASCTGLRGSVP
jgi:hypothetical protein